MVKPSPRGPVATGGDGCEAPVLAAGKGAALQVNELQAAYANGASAARSDVATTYWLLARLRRDDALGLRLRFDSHTSPRAGLRLRPPIVRSRMVSRSNSAILPRTLRMRRREF